VAVGRKDGFSFYCGAKSSGFRPDPSDCSQRVFSTSLLSDTSSVAKSDKVTNVKRTMAPRVRF